MATEVIMPKVDMVMETGTFVEWLKNEGDRVSKGDALFVTNTDKAAIEVESTADGILAGLRANPGDVIPVTEVIAYILAPGEALPEKVAPQPVAAVAVSVGVATAPAATAVEVAALSANHGKLRASPLARRMAQELHIDLAQVAGRGPRGRVHIADVLAFQKLQSVVECPETTVSREIFKAPAPVSAPAAAVPYIPLPDARRKEVVALAGSRKIIAERLAYSAFTAPHINLSLRVDMTEVIRLRERLLEPLKAQTGQRVSYTAILVRAVASVLPRHPYLNASISAGSIILWDDIHLGIATSIDESLIVPVIREAQNQSLGRVVLALADLTERARSRRLAPAEMSGSTFTISNLGMYGIESFTAIINPPEAAILAVGKMVDTPVRSGDGFEFRPMIELTVCADHRIVDGVAVARFLDDLKSTLENPYLLI
ncbi:MAG TPA: dihydrolipoamide acetyltransferase family protein [Levilinea sp.]|nr:dihydrolipoamide acetyltransferase family protein [Levilinea sp.]